MAVLRRPAKSGDPFKLTMMIFAVIAFMYFTGEVLKPLALAVLLSFALAPAVRLLEGRGLPRSASVVMTVVITLGLLGGVGYVVGEQLTSLANGLPKFQANIENKLNRIMKPGRKSATSKLQEMADEVTANIEKQKAPAVSPEETAPIQKVQVVQQASIQERLRGAIGPYLEFLGVGSFVLILVLFILMSREQLSDRIIGLFGSRQVSLTTRTMEEIGRRITRYLGTFALVNSCFGLVIGTGLAIIGVPYAALWGCLAAMMRFIPYVGPAVAFALPLIFSFAHSRVEEWWQPVEVIGLFAVVEVILNSFLEPVIYGKTTGVSPLGLLFAAMFWTWLWGTLGLLLSTPLTVCLAVLGKYVPKLGFFATLLGEEAELEADVRFYQRLVALDRDGAVGMIEDALKKKPREEIFDQVLIPALSRAERDAAHDELGDQEQAFVWRIVGEVVDNLEGTSEVSLAAPFVHNNGEAGDTPKEKNPLIQVLGLAVEDTSDVLVLKMLGQLLKPGGCELEIVTEFGSPMELAARVEERSPSLVVLSHLPPEGLTQARYLARRLRAQFAKMPLVVGRWGETGGAASAAERLTGAGATHVSFTLAEARDYILASVKPKQETTPFAPNIPDRTLNRGEVEKTRT